MNDKIKKLQNELNEELEKVQKIEIEKELTRLKESVGKCYASHTFTRGIKSVVAEAFLIKDVIYKEDYKRYYYTGHHILYKNFNGKTEISTNINHEKSYPLYSSIKRYQLSKSKFNTMFLELQQLILSSSEKLTGNVEAFENMSMGQYDNNKSKSKYIHQVTDAIIDLKDDPEFLQRLAFDNHPFLIGNILVDLYNSKKIIKIIIKGYKKRISRWGGEYGDRDREIIDLYEDRLKKYW